MPLAINRAAPLSAIASLPNARRRVYYSRPGTNDVEGRDFDATGRLTGAQLAELEPTRDAQAYLCGPARFMDEISAALAAIGIDASHIHTEPFGPAAGLTPTTRGSDEPAAARAGRFRFDPAEQDLSLGLDTLIASR